MKRTSRILALVMAFAMVLSLASVAFAATDATSAELVFSAEGVDLSGKLAFSPEEGTMSLGASMTVNGETAADLTAYLSGKALVLASTLLDAPYGVEFDNLAENLRKSVFAPNSGSRFALDQQTFEQIMALITNVEAAQAEAPSDSDTPVLNQAGLAEIITGLTPAFNRAIDIASKNMTMQSSTGKLSINGKNVAVQTVKVQYTTASVIALYDSLLADAENDVAVQNAIIALIDFLNSTGADMGVTGTEFVQALVEHNQEMRDTMAEELANVDMRCELTVSSNNEGTAPVELGIKLTIEGETVEMKLQISESGDYICLETNAGGETAALVFTITENTEDALRFRVSIQSDADEDAIAYTQDKKAQTFEISLIEVLSGQTTITTFSGHYVVEENLFSLVLDTVNGADMGGSIILNLRNSDALHMPSFTEITQLTEEELTNVIQNLAAGVQALDALFSGEEAA